MRRRTGEGKEQVSEEWKKQGARGGDQLVPPASPVLFSLGGPHALQFTRFHECQEAQDKKTISQHCQSTM